MDIYSLGNFSLIRKYQTMRKSLPVVTNQRYRFDYFIIWGNGKPNKEEILDIIRSKKYLKILRIMDYRPKSIDKLIRTVYSYDYAPFKHLKSKTRYLKKTDPDVTLIFVRNESPREIYRGKGAFRHIECERIKSIKEEIRNRFNPRRNGKRTEEHVIHASDNESQTDNMLKAVGYKQGIGFLKSEANPILSCPFYLTKFDAFTLRYVDSAKVYCNILRGTKESYWTEAIPIDKTPHFACLKGSPKPYQTYLTEFLGGPLTYDYSVENLLTLSRNLTYLKDPYATSYILVREFSPDQYLILDGVHRANILKNREVDCFVVAIRK